MCDSACPNNLPVSNLFALIGSDLQGMFEYVPGRNLEEEPPVSAFREEELQTETDTE
jgi:formate dehydrogenase subunit beta